jgi:hypothetical protein
MKRIGLRAMTPAEFERDFKLKKKGASSERVASGKT